MQGQLVQPVRLFTQQVLVGEPGGQDATHVAVALAAPAHVCLPPGHGVLADERRELGGDVDEARLEVAPRIPPDLDREARPGKRGEGVGEAVVGALELGKAVAVEILEPVAHVPPQVQDRVVGGRRARHVAVDQGVEAAVGAVRVEIGDDFGLPVSVEIAHAELLGKVDRGLTAVVEERLVEDGKARPDDLQTYVVHEDAAGPPRERRLDVARACGEGLRRGVRRCEPPEARAERRGGG